MHQNKRSGNITTKTHFPAVLYTSMQYTYTHTHTETQRHAHVHKHTLTRANTHTDKTSSECLITDSLAIPELENKMDSLRQNQNTTETALANGAAVPSVKAAGQLQSCKLWCYFAKPKIKTLSSTHASGNGGGQIDLFYAYFIDNTLSEIPEMKCSSKVKVKVKKKSKKKEKKNSDPANIYLTICEILASLKLLKIYEK